MKNRLLLLLWIFSIIQISAQLSKKEVKKLSKNIESSFLKGNYKKVDSLTQILMLNQSIIKPSIFQFSLQSNYNLHDLEGALKSLKYYHFLKLETKIETQVSQETIKQINTLEDILELQSSLTGYSDRTTYEKIKNIGTNFWLTYVDYGMALYAEKSYTSAIDNLEKALRWNANLLKVNTVLADAYQRTHKYKKSNEQIKILLSKGENDIELYQKKARNHHFLNEFEKSIVAINKVIESKPNETNYLLRFFSQQQKGDQKETYKTGLILLGIAPTEDKYFYYLLYESEELGLKESLKEAVDSLSLKKPNEVSYYKYKLEFYDRKDQTNYNFFVTQYKKIISLEPNNSKWYLRLGDYVFQRNMGSYKTEERYNLAKKNFDKVLVLDSSSFDAYYYLIRMNMWGNKSLAKKYKREGISVFKNKIKEEPKNSLLYFQVGKLYNYSTNGYGSSNKNRDSTLVYYQKALELGHDSLEVLDYRRNVYWWRKSYKECKQDNYWVLSHTDDDFTKTLCYYKISDCCEKLDAFEEEYVILEKLIIDFPEEKDDWAYKRRVKELKQRK